MRRTPRVRRAWLGRGRAEDGARRQAGGGDARAGQAPEDPDPGGAGQDADRLPRPSPGAHEDARADAAAQLAREVLDAVAAEIKPGVTTDLLDEVTHRECVARKAYPSPLNYRAFPKSVCT
jgi:hypothetical protein